LCWSRYGLVSEARRFGIDHRWVRVPRGVQGRGSVRSGETAVTTISLPPVRGSFASDRKVSIVQQQILSRLFEEYFGVPPVTVLPLEGDGSSRKMFRLVGPAYETTIGVLGPDREENQAFLTYSRALRGAGLSVPEIYLADEEHGAYLEEDLGDTTLF